MPSSTSELRVGDLAFEVRQSGTSGDPVILLHGFPQTSWSWHHQLEALGNEGYRAVAFDQRGYSPGARPTGVKAYALPQLASDVLDVADALGVGQFHLVGHDWGAMVAWAVAGWHPGRLLSLTAVSVPHPSAFGAALLGGDEDQVGRSSYIDVFRAEGGVAERLLLGEDGSGDGLRAMFAASGMPGERYEEVEVFVEAMREPGALTAALNWYRAMDGADLAGIGPIEVPTLYVWSTEDVALGRTAAEATEQWVTGPYRFEVLQGVSHWIPETAADQLDALLLTHLGNQRGARD